MEVKPGLRPALPELVVADGEAAPAEAEPEQHQEDQQPPEQVPEQNAAGVVPAEQAAAAAV